MRRVASAAEGMAIPDRHGKPAGTYFVPSRTWENRTLFTKPTACEIFVRTLLHYRSEGVYSLQAFVLMPEHFHILLTPSPYMTLERAVQYIKGGAAHSIRKELQYRFPIWQRGFSDHRIRNAADYESHLLYIDQNPVKRGLVVILQDYSWSSASGRFALDDRPQRLKPSGVMFTALRHG